jgi:glutamyl-tRNA synthetase
LPWAPEQFDMTRFEAMAPLVQERIGVMSEIPAMIDFLFLPEAPMDEDAFAKSIAKDEKSRVILRALADELSTVTWDRDQLHATVQAVGERHEWNLRKTQAPVRCALTGRLVGPPLFESMELLGRDETIRRVRQAAERAS